MLQPTVTITLNSKSNKVGENKHDSLNLKKDGTTNLDSSFSDCHRNYHIIRRPFGSSIGLLL
jgi:uncharacterized ParB-like nuclease family protein